MKTKEFIKKAQDINGDMFDYSKVKCKTTKDKITIICNKHGIEFNQLPYNHLKGQGCSECKTEKITRNNKKYTTEEFINELKKIHGEKYDYSKLEYTGLNKTIVFICEIHGEQKKIAKKHLNGTGCTKCGRRQSEYVPTTNITTEEWIERAKNVHGDMYDYSEVVYENCKNHITIICKKHGSYKQNPTSHIRGAGCSECTRKKKQKHLKEIRYKNPVVVKKTLEYFIQKASSIHNNFYDYSKVDYQGNKEKVIIICPEHGQFSQTAGSHLQGHKCFKCNGSEKYTNESFAAKANVVHNNKYTYGKVEYTDNKGKVIITCPKHGDYTLVAKKHIEGRGCQKCNLCEGCELFRTLKKKLCSYCEPKETNKLYVKTKEMKIVNFLRENLPDQEFIHNKSVGTDCTGTNLFPDIRFDMGHYNLIVEVDEFKHRGKSYECDEQRMYDIVAKLGTPCVFLRYNPDDKKSDKNKLLKYVKKYLELVPDDEEVIWNDYGLKTKYLFY